MTSLARVVLGQPHEPTLVVLHGVTSAAIGQADALLHWADLGYRVVGVDARGHGLSPRWTTEQLARAGDVLVEDVLAVLDDLALESRLRREADLPTAAPPVFIGHSMGAATAMAVAVQRPELVSGVVLEDPARYGSRTSGELLERGAGRARDRAEVAGDLLAAATQYLQDESVPPIEALQLPWAIDRTDPDHLRSGVVTPSMVWEEGMAALEVPVLVLTGDAEGARVGAQGAQYLAALNKPNIETVMVPGAGHLVRRFSPQQFYGAVDAFVARVMR